MSTVEEGRGREEAMQITLTHGDNNNKTAQEEGERENIKSIVLERVKEPKGKGKEEAREVEAEREQCCCYTCCYCSLFPVLSDTCVISTGAKKARDDTSHKALRKTKGKAWKIHPPKPKTKPWQQQQHENGKRKSSLNNNYNGRTQKGGGVLLAAAARGRVAFGSLQVGFEA